MVSRPFLPMICGNVYSSINYKGFCDVITLEFVLSSLIFILLVISGGIILSPNNTLAVDDNGTIWNGNLYFSTWVSVCLIIYILADLVTTSDNDGGGGGGYVGGLVPRVYMNYMDVNAISRAWILLFIGTISLLVFSSIYSSSSEGTASIVGITFGTLGLVLCLTYWLACFIDKKRRVTWSRAASSTQESQSPKSSKKNLISSVLSVLAFICYSINVAFVTSSGSYYRGMIYYQEEHPANVYFVSWTCFGISLYLCMRHAEMYFVPGSQQRPVIVSSNNGTNKKRLLLQAQSQQGRFSRSSSRGTSASSSSGGDHIQRLRIDADDALTAMVESQSEDGPILFLPADNHNGGNNNGRHNRYAQDIDGDDEASYPSVRPKYLPKQNGREPHKARPQSPGGYKKPLRQSVFANESDLFSSSSERMSPKLEPDDAGSAPYLFPQQGGHGSSSPPPQRKNTQHTFATGSSEFVETVFSEQSPGGVGVARTRGLPPPPPPPPRSTNASECTSIGPNNDNGTKSTRSRSYESRRSYDVSSRRSRSRSSEGKRRRSSSKKKSTNRRSSKSPASSYSRGNSTRSGAGSGPSTVVSGSRGPSTVSSNSHGSGAPEGPLTVSASEGSSHNRRSTSTGSGPRTASVIEGSENIKMGRIGPRDVAAPPPPPPPPPREGDVDDDNFSTGFDPRPVKAVYNRSSSDGGMSLMSDISHPSADLPPPSRSKSKSPENCTDAEKLRYSFKDLNPKSPSKTGANENKVVRQGAVDKMVMEALRQAQEARTSKQYEPAPPPPRRSTSQLTNPQASSSAMGLKKALDKSYKSQKSMHSYYSQQESEAVTSYGDVGGEYAC